MNPHKLPYRARYALIHAYRAHGRQWVAASTKPRAVTALRRAGLVLADLSLTKAGEDARHALRLHELD